MKMKNVFAKRGTAAAAALLMLLSAAGCAGTGGESSGTTSGGSGTGTGGDPTDLMSIEMPTADLSNSSKVLKVFGWSTMADNQTDGEAAEYFQQEFGVTIEETVSTHDNYWSDLARMVSAGTAPDVVDLSEDKYFPVPVVNGLLEPWDDLIDFSSALWANTQEANEANKWRDKIYFPIVSEYVKTWCFYNKNMFKNYGLEDENPRTLWQNGEWTLDKMVELSDQFIEKNRRNEITQWGLTVQNLELLSITGVQLVGINNGTEIVNNFTNEKIAKVFNDTYPISEAGSGSFTMSMDACPVFEQEQCAMLISASTLLTETRFAHLRDADNLGFAPMPRLDDETPQVVEMSIDPGYGLITGTENKELAVLWLNYLKWFRLGEHPCAEVPVTEDTPAKARYNLEADTSVMSEEDIAFINEFLDSNPQKVYTTYRSIVQNMGDLTTFKWEFFTGKVQWSSAIQQLSPVYQAQLEKWVSA